MDKDKWAHTVLTRLQEYCDLTHWDIRIEWSTLPPDCKWGYIRLDERPKVMHGRRVATLFLNIRHPNLEECIWRLLIHLICYPYDIGVLINYDDTRRLGNQMGNIITDLVYHRRAIDIDWGEPSADIRWWVVATVQYWQQALQLDDWEITLRWGQRPLTQAEVQQQCTATQTKGHTEYPLLAIEHHIIDEQGKKAELWIDLDVIEWLSSKIFYGVHALIVYGLLHILVHRAEIGYASIMQLHHILVRLHGILPPAIPTRW